MVVTGQQVVLLESMQDYLTRCGALTPGLLCLLQLRARQRQLRNTGFGQSSKHHAGHFA